MFIEGPRLFSNQFLSSNVVQLNKRLGVKVKGETASFEFDTVKISAWFFRIHLIKLKLDETNKFDKKKIKETTVVMNTY